MGNGGYLPFDTPLFKRPTLVKIELPVPNLCNGRSRLGVVGGAGDAEAVGVVGGTELL